MINRYFLFFILIFSSLSQAQVQYVVNSIDDFEDIDLADQLCADQYGNCTLRAAIQNANKTSKKDKIAFGIPGCGPFTIKINEKLPEIIQPVNIDATTQEGYSINTLKIIISGENLSLPSSGYFNFVNKGLNLVKNSGGSSIKGLVINSIIGVAILIETSDNVIQSNYLGITADGNSARGNNGGLIIMGQRNLIGGYCESERNVISGNRAGIMLYSKNKIIGNYIGTNFDGTAAVGNKWGIEMPFFSVESELSSNLISGNEVGLSCQGENNIITKNFIGTDITGTKSLKNDIGLRLITRSKNYIGFKKAGNLISGNDVGIWVYYPTPEISQNVFLANYVGVDITGGNPLPNNVGIRLDNVGQNFIGDSGEGLQNIISGNCIAGIEIKNSFRNQISNNYIGTNSAGTHAVPNGTGIRIFNSMSENNNGDNQIENNIIAGNNNGGILIENSFLNTIRRNFIGYSPRSGKSILNSSFNFRGPLSDNCIGSTDPFLDNISHGNYILNYLYSE